MAVQMDRVSLFPVTAEVNNRGHLVIGGCDTAELAAEFGTPLYLFDEFSLRSKCAEFKAEYCQRYAATTVLYACKAFINKALLLLLKEEGMGLDVVSGGELGFARSVDFPLNNVYFHGNNKSAAELELALEWGVGRIVVDNFHELKMLGEIARRKGRRPDILLRISPGVDPHTHKYVTTGNIDSKFGFSLSIGEEALVAAISTPEVNLVGLHFHIGSLIAEVEPYEQAIEYIIGFAADMKQKHGFELKELDVGGGVAVQYTLDSPVPPVSVYAGAIAYGVLTQCERRQLTPPRLILEPGRSIVARAGVALYEIGAIKEIPGVRTYVCVDGGMGDNIRPALYGAKLEAVIANRMKAGEAGKFTIAGKFCESGDILIRDLDLPQPKSGDILAVPGCGAYSIPQASNYNAFFLPAIIMVNDGKARLIRRRETLADLTGCDIV